MIGSKEKDSYSTQKSTSRHSLMLNPYEKDSYTTEKLSLMNFQLVGLMSSSHDAYAKISSIFVKIMMLIFIRNASIQVTRTPKLFTIPELTRLIKKSKWVRRN